MNRRTAIRLLAGLLCLSIAGGWYYFTFLRVQNVFDEMYYSRIHSRRLFQDVEQLQTPARDADQGTLWMGDSLFECYDTRLLEPGHRINIDFHVSSTRLYFDYLIEMENGGQEWYEYVYDVKEKTLTYQTSGTENPAGEHFLFDRVLPDWFAANGGKTRFSLDHLGNFTYIEP